MKKIVVVNSSSYENGNCDLLCSEFIRGASNNPENKIVRFNLKDSNIDFYRENQAEDDADLLAREILDSNVVVLATPVYFYTMSGLMKTFIDRMMPYYNDLSGKDFYYFLTSAINRSEMEAAVESLNGFTDSIPDSRVVSVVLGSNVLGQGDIKDHPAFFEAYQLGINL